VGSDEPDRPPQRDAHSALGLVVPSEDGTGFVHSDSGERFFVWGFNYDHDHEGRLIEDYWRDEWAVVVEDFHEMKALGANTVRIHLQFGRFVKAPGELDRAALGQLECLMTLAEEVGLYIDLTGLGCYHKQDIPRWYDALDEAARWDQQALFWEGVARIRARSPALFCYDLMNEPILPGKNETETDWLAGAFDGKYFVQRIALDLAGRTRPEVAGAWVEKLVAAIGRHDQRHMVTVGVIPWAYTFPGAKPLFYSDAVGAGLDFAAVHFYPERGKVDKALEALAVYDVGKPLIVEEMFPLKCSSEEMDELIDRASHRAPGFISFYWGRTPADYAVGTSGLAGAVIKSWLEYLHLKGGEIVRERSHRQ